MQSNELPKPLPTTYPTIQGDPATRRFAIFFFCTLAIITIGVMIGIGVGNISHYGILFLYIKSINLLLIYLRIF
ncbi:unnamed protein product [Rotaria sp. Silwood1]|nr:unnamed protein product [Rotaria sp. Silwood1]